MGGGLMATVEMSQERGQRGWGGGVMRKAKKVGRQGRDGPSTGGASSHPSEKMVLGCSMTVTWSFK